MTVERIRIVIFVGAWQFTQEIPALIDAGRFANDLELFARPVNSLQGNGVESIGVEEGSLVVIPQDGYLGVGDNFIKAFARIGAIANNVTQAQNVTDVLTANVGKYRRQRFQIRVDIAN